MTPPNSAGAARALAVRGMFSAVAPRYDLMNRLMTGGMDISWRKEVIRRAALTPASHLLDLGAGTGDLAREALRQQPACRVTAGDFTLEMMLVGKKNYAAPSVWTGADALNLPFMRNVVDLERALSEQRRVLRPGGRFVCLDTTRPGKTILTPFIQFHMRRVIPFLGSLLSRDPSAYVYLPETSEHFLSAEELLARIDAAGFAQTGFRRVNFGTVAIHWGQKQ